MLRACWLASGLVLAGCPSSEPIPPVVDVPPGYTGPVTLTIESHATGHVVSTPPGIDCPKTCSAEFTVGTPILLELTEHYNYFVALFSSPCQKQDGNGFACSFTITGGTRIIVEGGQEVR